MQWFFQISCIIFVFCRLFFFYFSQKFVYFSSFESMAQFERLKLFCLVLDPQKFLHSLVLTITLQVNTEHNSIPFFDLWPAGVFISRELWRFHISDDTIFPDIFRFYFISISVVIWARSDFSWLMNVPWSFLKNFFTINICKHFSQFRPALLFPQLFLLPWYLPKFWYGNRMEPVSCLCIFRRIMNDYKFSLYHSD